MTANNESVIAFTCPQSYLQTDRDCLHPLALGCIATPWRSVGDRTASLMERKKRENRFYSPQEQRESRMVLSGAGVQLSLALCTGGREREREREKWHHKCTSSGSSY